MSDDDGSSPSEDPVPEFVREKLLEHPLRNEIVELLRERPGMNKHQLGKAVGVHSHQLDHHLEQLEEAGLVCIRPAVQEQEWLCFTADDEDLWENERTRILFGREKTRQVALYLSENPGATTQEIADALETSPVTVRYHLRNLRGNDLVSRHPAGRKNLYAPEEELEEWVCRAGRGYQTDGDWSAE